MSDSTGCAMQRLKLVTAIGWKPPMRSSNCVTQGGSQQKSDGYPLREGLRARRAAIGEHG
jgi:hypothetical protein